MPKKKVKTKVKPIQVQQQPSEPANLRIFIAEAQQVDLMRRHPGWEILERDLEKYRGDIGARLAYLNPETLEYDEARIMYLASDKLLKMVEDYATNKRRALEFLEKLDNPSDNIILDVDN